MGCSWKGNTSEFNYLEPVRFFATGLLESLSHWKRASSVLTILPAVAALSVAPFTVKPALAGTYVLTAMNAAGEPTPTGGELDFDDGTNAKPYDLISGGYGAGGANHCGMSLSGPISATFTWQPADGMTAAQDPPPQQVLIHQHCEVYAVPQSAFGNLLDADADNGLGSQVVNTPPTDGNTVSVSSDCVGDKYTPTAGGLTVTAPDCKPSGDADGSEGFGALGVTYSCDVSTATVTITRYGAHNETIDGNGVTHGDTIWSYNYLQTNGGSSPLWNWQQFHSTLNGHWSQTTAGSLNGTLYPDVTWNWQPAYSEDTLNWNQWEIPLGSLSYYEGTGTWSGSATPSRVASISETVTDNQTQLSAVGTYVLAIHDPYEVKVALPVYNTHDQIKQVSNFAEVSSPGQQLMFYVEYAQTWSGAIDLTGLSDIIAATTLGLGIDFQFSYSVAVNTGVGVTVSDCPVGYGTCLIGFLDNAHHDGTNSSYDAGGYTGEVAFAIPHPIGVTYEAQVPYIYLGTGTTPGGGATSGGGDTPVGGSGNGP